MQLTERRLYLHGDVNGTTKELKAVANLQGTKIVYFDAMTDEKIKSMHVSSSTKRVVKQYFK